MRGPCSASRAYGQRRCKRAILAFDHGGDGREAATETVDDFIRRQNIENFAFRLQTEGDASVQATLRKLLLEEMKRFGVRTEALLLVDEHLSRNAKRISEQTLVVEEDRKNGRATAGDEALLVSLTHTQTIFHGYRATLLAALERGEDD